jgi:hypothetical protein
MAGNGNENEQMAEARSAATAAIVGSEADKKLVVAGPGTGKTYTFKQALQNVEGKGLALTFIRNLVSDLEEALGDLADVFTFHGFCKRQMHLNSTEGLVGDLDYYPPFLDLVEPPAGLTSHGRVVWNLDALLHETFGRRTVYLNSKPSFPRSPLNFSATFISNVYSGYYLFTFADARGSQFKTLGPTKPPKPIIGASGAEVPLKVEDAAGDRRSLRRRRADRPDRRGDVRLSV